jgi:hypothetical protein
VVAALLVVVGIVGASIAVLGGGVTRSSSGTVPPSSISVASASSTAAAPDPSDVAAARTCRAWDNYLSAGLTGTVSPAVGQALLSNAEALLAGAKQDEAAGRALPKWTELAGEVLAGAQDVVNGNIESLQTDGAAVAVQCKLVPAAAAAIGGFVRS